MLSVPLIRLDSKLDRSVNFVSSAQVGYFESRYVSRPEKDYFIVYLSSQSGCAKACRMCHLTATQQVRSVDASLDDFRRQALEVLRHWESLGAAHVGVHFNFMARGEPLACSTVLHDSPALLSMLEGLALERGLTPSFLVSSILPKRVPNLVEVFPHLYPEIYYSLYAISPRFRQRWLPQALPVQEALQQLKGWQVHTSKRVRVHFAYIDGWNDSEQDVQDMCQALSDIRLLVDINVVRYNPPDDTSRESLYVERNADIMRKLLPNSTVKVIPRVGFDVQASCGTFFAGQ